MVNKKEVITTILAVVAIVLLVNLVSYVFKVSATETAAFMALGIGIGNIVGNTK